MLLSLLLFGCTPDEEIVYEQFNADDDALSVEVGSASELEAISIDLHSSTGAVVVGQASVDPSGGPSGTVHTLTVEVYDDYEHIVDRASVRTDSGDRGVDEYDMEGDSADEGLYVLELTSVASDGESRTDKLTIRLWDVDGDDDGDGQTDTSEG